MLAHSMGGIATRLMLLQPRLPRDSIKTVITLSTPHMMPPASFDSGIETVYSEINGYWQDTYSKQDTTNLSDLVLISIAGGTADSQIASDYSGVAALCPSTNGFTVLTSAVPSLFSSVDHVAMMWCDQLRQSIVSAMIRIGDATKTTRARPLGDRLAVFKAHLLIGLEDEPSLSLPGGAQVMFRQTQLEMFEDGMVPIQSLKLGQAQNFALRLGKKGLRKAFTLLSSLRPSEVVLYACKSDASQYICTTIDKPSYLYVPLSTPRTPTYPVPPTSGQNMLYLKQLLQEAYDEIVVSVVGTENTEQTSDFLYMQADATASITDEVSLLREGSNVSLKAFIADNAV